MAFRPTRPGAVGGVDETAEVVRHYESALNRALDFLGYSIHDVVNDPVKKDHVRRAFLVSKRIERDLTDEPWRTEATEALGEVLSRRLGSGGPE
jgi:hypothetical protein